MPENIRISYLTTNYNKNDVLKDGLESILEDLPADGELVVVDGGSTDGSIKTLHQLEEDNPRLRVHIEDSNLGEGRRIARSLARGDILVQHLDTDRRYDSELTTLLEIFENVESEEGLDDLVLITLDSLYICRAELMGNVIEWPPLPRVEERVFADRVETNATPRILPIEISEELPTTDRASLRGRLLTWRDSSRDLLRTGFSLWQLIRWNHYKFDVLKATIADALAVWGAIDAHGRETYPSERTWNTVESWQDRYTTEQGKQRYPDIRLDVPERLRQYQVDPGQLKKNNKVK